MGIHISREKELAFTETNESDDCHVVYRGSCPFSNVLSGKGSRDGSGDMDNVLALTTSA